MYSLNKLKKKTFTIRSMKSSKLELILYWQVDRSTGVLLMEIRILCTTFHRYPIFSTRYSVMCKVYTGYCGTSEIEHGLCACGR